MSDTEVTQRRIQFGALPFCAFCAFLWLFRVSFVATRLRSDFILPVFPENKCMPSKYDIFISYGHLDDEDPAGDVQGWVDLLVERLPRLVSSSLGYLPKVGRDQRSLTGDALLSAAIEEGISHSLLFVPIVTPRYVH